MTTLDPEEPGSDVVRYEVVDRVAWLTIDRPEARNALIGRGARRAVGRRAPVQRRRRRRRCSC